MECAICHKELEDVETAFCHCNIGPIHYQCLTEEVVLQPLDPKISGNACEGIGWPEWVKEQRAAKITHPTYDDIFQIQRRAIPIADELQPFLVGSQGMDQHYDEVQSRIEMMGNYQLELFHGSTPDKTDLAVYLTENSLVQFEYEIYMNAIYHLCMWGFDGKENSDLDPKTGRLATALEFIERTVEGIGVSLDMASRDEARQIIILARGYAQTALFFGRQIKELSHG